MLQSNVVHFKTKCYTLMCRVGTNFWLKIGNFFLGNLFQILKRPLDVKKSPDSKSAIFMSVSQPAVHEFEVFMLQKFFKINLQEMVKKVSAVFRHI